MRSQREFSDRRHRFGSTYQDLPHRQLNLIASNHFNFDSCGSHAGDLIDESRGYGAWGSAESEQSNRLQNIIMCPFNVFRQVTKVIYPEGSVRESLIRESGTRAKSIGRENTFAENIFDQKVMERELFSYAEKLASRLRAR